MVNRKKEKDYVMTVSKNKVLKVNCVLINKEYYEKNIDCFLIVYKNKDKWIPYDNSYCFNFTNNQYEKKKDLIDSGLFPFLIGFGKGNNNLIFGYDISNYTRNTIVCSHYGDKSNEYKLYTSEWENCNNRLKKLRLKLEPNSLFMNFYNTYIDVLSKIYYYRNFINTEVALDNLQYPDFVKILKETENYILRNMDIKNDFKDFYSEYREAVHYQIADNGANNSEGIKRLTSEIVMNNPILNALLDFCYAYFDVTTSINNDIKIEQNKLLKFEKKLEYLKKLNFFQGKCRTKEDAVNLGFVECLSNDNYYLKQNLSGEELTRLTLIPPHHQDSAYSKAIKINHNVLPDNNVFSRILEGYYSNRDEENKMTKDSYSTAKLLEGLTFGIEFETSLGRIREPDLYKYGIIPLRDGSISGFEYTSIPYGYSNQHLTETNTRSLAKDLTNLKELCNELSKRCIIDSKCSMHIHIGNVRKDKLYLIAVYMLCHMLQNELFEMFPKYKEDGPKYLGTIKNYCKKLPHLELFNNCIFDKSTVLKENYCDNVNLYFNKIFKFLSDGEEIGSKFNRKNLEHPIDKKWDRLGRYSWVNLVNSVFSSSRTIEFRLHTATLNFEKTLNWILICSAIVKFANTHTKEIISGKISKISLSEVIYGYTNNFRDKKTTNETGLFVHKYLNEYINTRKVYFANKAVHKDYICADELNEDKNYSFSYLGVSTLI